MTTETKIVLNKPYVNIKSIVDFELTSPDGFTITHRMKIPNPMKELFAHSGILIKEIPQTREVDGSYAEIEGISLEIRAPNELVYKSKDKLEAGKTYRTVIKPSLEERGYCIESHDCLKQVPCDAPRTYGTKLKIQ